MRNDTKSKNTYGLGMGISKVIKIIYHHFLFLGYAYVPSLVDVISLVVLN